MWFWGLCHEQFPGAIQVVDLWHAKQTLWDITKELHRDETRLIALEAGRLQAVLAALRSASGNEKAAKCAEYVQHNRAWLRYADLRGPV